MVIFTNKCKGSFCVESPLHLFFAVFIIRSGALRQLVVLVPCLWLLIRTMGIEKAWFAFWVSEVVACAYSLWATKKELRNKVK